MPTQEAQDPQRLIKGIGSTRDAPRAASQLLTPSTIELFVLAQTSV